MSSKTTTETSRKPRKRSAARQRRAGKCTGAEVPPEREQQVLARVVKLYECAFADSPIAREYLTAHAITDARLVSDARVGYSDGTLPDKLPGDGKTQVELMQIGVLLEDGTERFRDCVVFPVFGEDGRIVTLCGERIGTERGSGEHLPDRPLALWNDRNAGSFTSLYVVDSVIDAMSLQMCGLPNVVSVQCPSELRPCDATAFSRLGIDQLTLIPGAGSADGSPLGLLAESLNTKIHTRTVVFPDGHTPNSLLCERGPQAVVDLLAKPDGGAVVTEDPRSSAGPSPAGSAGGDFKVTYSGRAFHILGLERGARKLKATVRVEHGGRLHVDTLDFYNARARRVLCQDLARIFDRSPYEMEGDVARLITACENWQPPAPGTGIDGAAAISEEDEKEAREFGRSPDLIEKIIVDFESCGLVGERHNKLLCYLAAVSRKMDEPLSVLILSSSGSGKSTLQDTTLRFCPPEDVIKLTSLTGKALFYKDEMSLKHKVLALEEEAGADEASYAIRNLISAGELVIETTVRDGTTGRLTSVPNRVQGPTAVFYTVTDPQVDPETRSRFFVLGIDESRDQTRAILERQRQRQKNGGLLADHLREEALCRHRNFQRLLQPLVVVNPFAEQLTYGDHRLQARRDQPKYLNLIRAIAFLRQMSKAVKSWQTDNGDAIPYIEVDLADVRTGNELATAVLGTTLDELSSPSRDLLRLLEEMVTATLDNLGADALDRSAVAFTRRQIREFTGWSNYRVHTHLRELVDLEYVTIESGRNGMPFRYRLPYDGEGKNGERFLLGLRNANDLKPGK